MSCTIIVYGVLIVSAVRGLKRQNEFQRYDGWYNNLAHPDWGTVGSKLYRYLPSNYLDGVYMIHDDRPSARALSDTVFEGPDGQRNERNMTTVLAFFSQVVAYEILQSSEASCPLEMHKIPIPPCDSVFDTDCHGDNMMPFMRAKYDKETGGGFNSPREQVKQDSFTNRWKLESIHWKMEPRVCAYVSCVKYFTKFCI